MPDHVSIDKKHQIILVKSSEQNTIEDVYHSIKKILELYSATGISKVLVDGRNLEAIISVGQAYDFSAFIVEDPRSRHLKWALVPSLVVMEEARFMETTSRNRGLNARIHEDIDSALTWLME